MSQNSVLRRARRLAAVAIGGAALVLGTAAHAAWRQAESAHFVVYGDVDDRQLTDFTRRLEEFDGLLRLFNGTPDNGGERKLPVYLVSEESDLRRIRPGLGDGVAGFYSAGPGDVFAAAIVGRDWGEDALLHEYVHHFMLHHYAGMYPGWLIEGYAEYFMTADFQPARTLVGRPSAWRAATLLDGGPASLESVIGKPRSKIDDTQRFYATSWALTHYMMADPARKRQLLDFLVRYAKGEAPLRAWEAATGETAGQTETKLRRYVRGGLAAYNLKRDAAAAGAIPVTVTALPASADDLLLYDHAVKIGLGEDHRTRYLGIIRRLAARHSGDPLAQLALGRIEARYGDAARGETILRKLIEENPQDEEALQALAFAKLDAAEKDGADKRALNAEAATLLGRAFKLDAEDYRTLHGFALSRSAEPNYPSENVVNVLDKAVALAPQVVPIRLRAAEAMIKRKLWDDAEWMLQPVAFSPHGGELSEKAQAMLKEIEAGAGRAAAPTSSAAR